ncbi:hypothetical protein LguiA_026182 [Lonicera macranthoides]
MKTNFNENNSKQTNSFQLVQQFPPLIIDHNNFKTVGAWIALITLDIASFKSFCI